MAIEDRIFTALTNEISFKSSKFFNELERLSGIKAGSWKHAYYGQQRVTCDMIEFAGRYAPQYAFWIITGALPDKGMEHLGSSKKDLKTKVLYDIVAKEPIDWTQEEVEIVVSNLFGGKNIDHVLFRLLSDGMIAREKKKLLNLKTLDLRKILMEDPDFWTPTMINYVLFKRFINPEDTTPYVDFVKANLNPEDTINLDFVARQEEILANVVERAESMRD